MENGFAFRQAGRFCGWPANNGAWTWGEEIVLRSDGGNWDLGYPRMVVRPDGKLVTMCYYNTTDIPEQHIAVTIWDPNEVPAATDSRDDAKDLVHWTPERLIPVMARKERRGMWAAGREGARDNSGRTLNLNGAAIVVDTASARNVKAAEMLRDEIGARTGLRLEVSGSLPGKGVSALILCKAGSFNSRASLPPGLSIPQKAEGYAIWAQQPSGSAPRVYLAGRDDRGVLFAAGRLIRMLDMSKSNLELSGDVCLADSPAYPMRGHMMIPDGDFIKWDREGFEQYIRDLVIFGTNSFELIRYYPFVAEILDDYGLDFWVYMSHKRLARAQSKRDVENMLGRLRGLDNVFIPLGDTSGVRPTRQVIPMAERFAALLKGVHPEAGIWLSHQNQENHAVNDNEYLFTYISNQRPEWLEGMVYGPWAHWDIYELRRRTPACYKIRHYPDICHNRWAQYQIPQWDSALADVWERNGIRAMPRMAAWIHRATSEPAEGFIAYNHTGCNNDLDKFVFSAMGWNPDADVREVLVEYGKVFFGRELAEPVAEGLLMLEDNWTGPLSENPGIERTLEHWQSIAKTHGDIAQNWRLKLFLCRAFIDAYIQRKNRLELKLESEAIAALEGLDADQAPQAARQALEILASAEEKFPARSALERELEAWGLDNSNDIRKVIDRLYKRPSNDRLWLEKQFKKLIGARDRTARLEILKTTLNWEDPGRGGFYDNLGIQGRQPHLVRQKNWSQDPGYVYSPIEYHSYKAGYRRSWILTATTRYDTPLIMRYEGLDPGALYRVRATYSGPFKPVMSLWADDRHLVHGPIAPPEPLETLDFAVPAGATKDGMLELRWELVNAVRGCQVAEVWLLKQEDQAADEDSGRGL